MKCKFSLSKIEKKNGVDWYSGENGWATGMKWNNWLPCWSYNRTIKCLNRPLAKQTVTKSLIHRRKRLHLEWNELCCKSEQWASGSRQLLLPPPPPSSPTTKMNMSYFFPLELCNWHHTNIYDWSMFQLNCVYCTCDVRATAQ